MGRYHDSVLSWVCIHKKWADGKNEIGSRFKVGCPKKEMIILTPEGKLLKFQSRIEAAKYFKTSTPCISDKIKHARKREDKRIRFNKICYKLIEKEEKK